MKNTMITRGDLIVIPTGLSAPAWVPYLTELLALPITVLTLIYMAYKVVDVVFHHRHRWKQRKAERLDNEKKKS